MKVSTALAAGALAMGVEAKNYLGFNSGATLANREAKFKADFMAEFKTAQNLKTAPGDFSAVRLYTNIQAYSEDDPIEAFEAAIDTKTEILLGVWTSGTDNIDKEINALKKAIEKYGTDLTDLIIGVSVGSEDLYRNSVTGVKNKGGVGVQPDALVDFINDFRKAFKSTPISKIPVGHVDTWDVWGNATNKAVLDAIDFIGVDEYPYYENGKGNGIENAGKLFNKAYEATISASGGKPVWVTETGWPYKGPDWDEAVPSVKNAQKYWRDVGCKYLFNKTPTFWYNLRDSNPDNKMKFAITENLSTTPLFDLSCDKVDDEEKTSSSAAESKTKTATSASKSTHASGSDETTMATATASATGSSGKDEDSTATATATGSGSQSKPTSASESGSASGSGSSGSGSASESGSSSGSGSGSGAGSASQSGSESAPAETPSTVVSGATSFTVSAAALAFFALFAL
ncbi:related to glucan 1,3-beta-glucosidase [Fusarium torulosum]|uniref:Related to glucan 1,3-beta-glucosidase n=1 Tax=Fusarium torulosum TaxID=33205 RepID=A0AAE8SET3_9HYPO|nr:related to glucan 1,3-beta-glucosidase [Fusarium torulosum]